MGGRRSLRSVATLREAPGAPLPSGERARYERNVTMAHAGLWMTCLYSGACDGPDHTAGAGRCLVHLHRRACAIPGSAAILAAPRAGDTPALPGKGCCTTGLEEVHSGGY